MAGYPVLETLSLNNLRFDNVSHYLTTVTSPLEDTTKYVFSGDFTIEAWINTSSLPTAGTWKYIVHSFSNFSVTNSFAFALARDIGGSLSLQFWLSSDGTNWINSSTYKGTVTGYYNFQVSTWYHVAVCRSGSTYNLFVNGFLVGQYIAASAVANFAGPIPITIGTNDTGTTFFNGYISNLRIVNGVAVYSAASNAGSTYYANSTVSYTNGNPDNTRSFAPPVVNLTATQSAGPVGSNINAITAGATSLLVCQTSSSFANSSFEAAFVDNSSYAQKINAVGYLPNLNRISSAPALPYPGYFSVAFSGTGQYLSAPAATAWAFGNGDFTVEAWIYPNALTLGTGIISSWTGTVAAGTAATSAWSLSMGASNAAAVRFNLSNGTTLAAFESTIPALTTGKWHHVAAVRIANTINIYTNGVKTFSGVAGAETTNITVATQTVQVGAVGGGTLFNGYISNARVIKALGAYSNTFTPYFYPLANTLLSNTGLTNYNIIPAAVGNTSGVQLLMCRYRTTTPDQSVNAWTVTPTGAPTANASVTPFYLHTNNNILSVVEQPKTASDVGPNFLSLPPSSNYNLGTGAFTIEGWFYSTNPTAGHTLISSFPTNTTGVGYWKLGLTTAGNLTLNYDAATFSINATSLPLTANTWTHVAVTRTAAGAYTFFVNGAAATNTAFTPTATQFGNSASSLWIGSQEYTGPLPPFTGYYNNIRITRGIVVYTGAFTPQPTALTTSQAAGTTNIVAIPLAANCALLLQANSTGGIADASPTAATISLYGNPQSNTYGALTTTSNSAYVSSINRLKLQLTVPSDTYVVQRKFQHLLDTVSEIAISARRFYSLPPDILMKENKFVQLPSNISSVEFFPKVTSVPMFDNSIGTNLYKQSSTSYQFWS